MILERIIIIHIFYERRKWSLKRSKKREKEKKKYTLIISIVLIILLLIGVLIYFTQYAKKNTETVTEEQSQNNEEQTSDLMEVKEDHANDKDEENVKDNTKDNAEKNTEAVPTKENTEEKNEEKIKEKNEDTKAHVNEKSKEEQSQKLKVENGYIVGQNLPEKPTYINGVIIANKKYPLPKNYAPGENKEARRAFDKMASDAKKQGFNLTAFSTYRSYEYQQTLYNRYVQKDGKVAADRYSARPGYSEHQTGLAFDIGEVGKENLWLSERFGESEAGKWLVNNAHNYGFILRYPKGKENITGYMYESWHFRYLGVDLATKVKESGLTLEEYLKIN